jgi:hypothetical protein
MRILTTRQRVRVLFVDPRELAAALDTSGAAVGYAGAVAGSGE